MSALIVGAAGTLGRACVEAYQRHGVVTIAADLRAPEIDGAIGVALDVTDPTSIDTLVLNLDEQEPLHAVVYAAGLNVTGALDHTNWDDFSAVMGVNLQGAFHVGAAIQRRLRLARRDFSAVFISSTAGLSGEAGGSVYCASKFGLLGFVEAFAAEIASLGGRANAVCPGDVDSPMLHTLAAAIGEREGRTASAVLADMAAASGFGRLIDPSEVAETCVWLTSPVASGISGQTIVVDGPRA
jgi:NAD(P)-dependent dehydrogenase (short-subunit alcohol dehydrogenase family)